MVPAYEEAAASWKVGEPAAGRRAAGGGVWVGAATGRRERSEGRILSPFSSWPKVKRKEKKNEK